MSSSTVVQHILILLARCSLFISCRKLLLGTLYKDLRSLSYTEKDPLSTAEVELHETDDEVEMGGLPTTSSRASSSRNMPPVTPMTAMGSYTNGIFMTKGNGSSLQSSLAQTAFSLCFEEGCILFLLVMCQALGIFDAGTRYIQWRISLFLLVSLVIIVAPLIQIFLFTYRENTWHKLNFKMRISLTLVPYILYLFAFSSVPLPDNMEDAGYFAHALARMTVLGTLILGLLSGFGAVSTAWSFQPFGGKDNIVSDKDIDSAAAALNRVRQDLAERLRDPRLTAAPEPSTSWFGGAFFKGSSETSQLHQEIDGLRTLESQMARNVDALRAHRSDLDFRRTLKGRMWTAVGKVFAVYCVFRIISSIRNVLFGPSTGGTSSPDIITYLLARFVALFPSIPLTPEQIASLSRQISLLLVGCIILSSVRVILWQVGRVIKASSRTIGASFLLLLLAQLMDTYLLSTLIQLRTSFPPEPSLPSPLPSNPVEQVERSLSPSENLFSSLPEYQLFGKLFDASFLAAAGVTAGVIWAHRQINRAEVFS